MTTEEPSVLVTADTPQEHPRAAQRREAPSCHSWQSTGIQVSRWAAESRAEGLLQKTSATAEQQAGSSCSELRQRRNLDCWQAWKGARMQCCRALVGSSGPSHGAGGLQVVHIICYSAR